MFWRTEGRVVRFEASNLKLVHASNVAHVSHVLKAMVALSENVELISRYRLSNSRLVELADWLRTPEIVTSILRRRAYREDDELLAVHQRFLSAAQLVFPLAGRLGVRTPDPLLRAIHSSYQSSVARVSRNARLIHSVDGLALRAFAQSNSAFRVLERRNFHHHVFEQDLTTYAGFPFVQRTDPLRDVLDEEYRLADAIIVYSEAVRLSLIENGVPAVKVRVIPLPAELKVAEPVRHERIRGRLLYVGRGDAFKGLDVAVAVAEMLGPSFSLRVAGPATRGVVEWMKRSRADVVYLGILSRAELSVEYALCEVMLSPSLESFGLAVGEAVAAGAVVLCRETTGIAEYLDKRVARVVQGRSPEDWANAVLDLRVNRPALGDAPMLARADRLSIASVVGDLIEVYVSGTHVPGATG